MGISTVGRRNVLAGLGTLAGGLATTGRSSGQTAELTVGDWGGDWNARIERVFEQPFSASHGTRILHDFGGAPERRTKLLAQRNLPRGSMDVAHLTDIDAQQMETAGVLEALDTSRLPNWQHIYPKFRAGFYVPYVVAAFVLVYNPDKVDGAPTSFADLLNPKYAGRVGIVDLDFNYYILAAALANGGTVTNAGPGYDKMLELKRAAKPRIYPSHEQTGAALKTGEIWITMDFVARALQWNKDGIPVSTAYPKEGTTVSSFGACIPKRAANKDLAYAYLNALLDPHAQGEMCVDSFYAPAIDNADIPATLRETIDFPRTHMNELNVIDSVYAGENNARWLDWWNKEFKA